MQAPHGSAKRSRVLFLFAHFHKGGMERAASNITCALGDHYEKHVAYFGTDDPPYPFHAILHDLRVPGSTSLGPISKLRNFVRRLRILKHFIKLNRIDTVISFGEAANVLNVVSGHQARTILSVHVAIEESCRDIGIYGWVYRRLIPTVYTRAHAIVAVSRDICEDVRARTNGAVPVVSIPNLYSTNELAGLARGELPSAWSFLESQPFLLNVGTLCFQKGQDLLIEAFAASTEIARRYILVLVGEGSEKAKLQGLAESLRVKDRVYFAGFVENPYAFMSRARAFILSSRYEGFPYALVEAMACGAPAISFDCPTGPAEILGASKFGVLVNRISANALSNAITAVVGDQFALERLKQLSLRRAADFDTDEVVSSWHSLLQSVQK